MSYLARETTNLSESFWTELDTVVVAAAKKVLTGRRFLHVFGPLGIGVDNVAVDDTDKLKEKAEDGLIITVGRRYMQIPMIYDDFILLARDLESLKKSGLPVDFSKAVVSASACAFKEDKLIYFGNKELGYTGLMTATGANKLSKKDWSKGENAFADVAAAIELLMAKNIYGNYSLIVSPDLYLQMQRLQVGTGLLEAERVEKLVEGHFYKSPVLGKGKALLVCPEATNMDLVIGQDMAAAYLEQTELNHSIRILETAFPRIKREQAIVIFE
ncbi:MAG: family 1 encapsulin nanocompartment shell protein [Acidaminococcaceae bacterium]|nr:family 1 encapsulin nanocompartment shell protein [Acidaminococcaceae bacterium]MDD4721902.1 family 1 encapsulin nanocompartment shell protein [Acidaminococcaceae bacterium]